MCTLEGVATAVLEVWKGGATAAEGRRRNGVATAGEGSVEGVATVSDGGREWALSAHGRE